MKAVQVEFLNARKRKLSLLAKIDILQGESGIAYDLENFDKAEKLDNAVEYAFEEMFKMIDMFEECYKLSYDNMETDWLINGKKF